MHPSFTSLRFSTRILKQLMSGPGWGQRAMVCQVEELTANLRQITACTGSDPVCTVALRVNPASGLGVMLTCRFWGLGAGG